ncbi:HAD-IC family P-type ATPase, partial [Desulfosarcina sp. OttesenSCG-928-A07]|nr:HAD-IC family P-type ATPase [Desulfosarcina sp. OttesenSCG-928-A07]
MTIESESRPPSPAFWQLSVEEIKVQLETDLDTGLSTAQVTERQLQYGPNKLTGRPKKGLFSRFISQFKSFMILILFVAAVISGVTGYLEGEGFTDAIIILAIVLVNACIGTAQETKAENALEALEKMSAPHCKVLRDGQVSVIDVQGLVPGDVVIIESGDLVPADMRLVEAVNLKIQESALTGESLPEEKHTDPLPDEVLLGDRENMAFSSAIVTYGRGRGIVTTTGMNTEMGKIADMLQSVPETQSPMQAKINQLGRILGLAAISICVLIFVAGTFQGREWIGMFMIAVSLAVAAIPEGLPAVSTIVLAVGMQRLAQKNAIVRNLPSVETLGSTTVICSDKTGTLTQNRMAVVRVFTHDKIIEMSALKAQMADVQPLLQAAILANDAKLSRVADAWQTTGDPTETALIDMGLGAGLNKTDLDRDYPREGEVPFDSERKMMSTIHRHPDGNANTPWTVYVKGGPDEVLERCTHMLKDGSTVLLDEAGKDRIRKANIAMAESALRVLAMAFRPMAAMPADMSSAAVEKDLVFCGLAGMMDPPREEARAAVATCRSAGIRPVMITGDHPVTALAIAENLGIRNPEDQTMTGADLEKMTEADLDTVVETTSVYARVAPEHKARIVKALQQKGAVVAMTG